MAYNTATEIKTRLGITGSGDDTFIGQLLDVAYAEIKQQIGYIFQSANATTQKYDAVRDVIGQDLKIGYHHTITGVTNGDGTSLVKDTDYVVRYDSVLRMLRSTGQSWTYQTDPEDAIEVTATFGLDTTHDLYKIVVELEAGLVEWLYRSRDTAIPSEVSFTAGSALILAPANWPRHLQAWLSMLKPVLI